MASNVAFVQRLLRNSSGVVTEGSFNFQPEGNRCARCETFYETMGHTILHFDNASKSEPAAIIAFYLADTKDGPLIEMLGDKEH